MPVTEFAIIHFKHDDWERAGHQAASTAEAAPNLIVPDNILTKLSAARECLERASGHTFRFFQQYKDNPIIYIIGKWDSTEAHRAFLESVENQQLLELMREDIASGEGDTGIQMWHLDVDAFDYPSLADSWLVSAARVACQRYTVPAQGRAEHAEGYDAVITRMRRCRSAVGGWRIEKEAEAEEWMIFFDAKDKMGSRLPAKDNEEIVQTLGAMELAIHVDELHMVALEGL
ncbi:hypothetical protein BKA64DRAFT_387312 [Cadophora sp. MPI-SDFR-AT-0126]|nr:hypothetical protein BKA64DRAFT_387312 [Leotiomycetes sp. MPI-SDFR-AT-0126]